jgi:DNA-binding transcriptional LysR family regulator
MNSVVVELSLLLVRFSKFLKIGVSPVLAPKLGQFARDYLDVVLDVKTDDSRMDIVAGGFDAGIHFGEYIEKDMIVVRVSPDLRPVIVGAPSYFKSTQGQSRRVTYYAIDVSISGTETRAYTDGNSRRARNPYLSR